MLEKLQDWAARHVLKRAVAERQRATMKREWWSALSGTSNAGFAGGAVNRLTASMAQWSGGVNADLDGSLVILRARARALCANNEWGRRFLSMVAANVAGPKGPTLQVRASNSSGKGLDKPANDAIEVHWQRWARRCDIRGQMDFAQMVRVAVKSAARDGEALVRVVRNRELPYGIALQLLEADRLDETMNARLDNGNVVRMGVELDSVLRAVAYYVKTSHPGDRYQANAPQRERIPARDLFHIYLPERAEQVRGYTWLHAVLLRSDMLHGYEEAAVIAARVGAAKMGIWVNAGEGAPSALAQLADGKDSTGRLQMSAEPGEFVQAPQGWDLKSWDPQYPTENYESFMKQCLRGIATGLDVATHNLSGDMTDVSYSSARIAELAERDQWMVLQDWFATRLLQPLYAEWLASALLLGQITLLESGKALPAERYQKFVDAARFQGRRWTWVDPLKEVQAARELIDEGLASRTEIAASQGREFEDVVEELGQEQKLAAAAGVDLSNAKAKPAPAPPPDDEPKET